MRDEPNGGQNSRVSEDEDLDRDGGRRVALNDLVRLLHVIFLTTAVVDNKSRA